MPAQHSTARHAATTGNPVSRHSLSCCAMLADCNCPELTSYNRQDITLWLLLTPLPLFPLLLSLLLLLLSCCCCCSQPGWANSSPASALCSWPSGLSCTADQACRGSKVSCTASGTAPAASIHDNLHANKHPVEANSSKQASHQCLACTAVK